MLAPSWLVMMSCCVLLVASVMESVICDSTIWRTTRCTIDSCSPLGEASKRRNCLERVSLESGQRRLPEPPDRRITFMTSW